MSQSCTVTNIFSLIYELGDYVTANDLEHPFVSNLSTVEILGLDRDFLFVITVLQVILQFIAS